MLTYEVLDQFRKALEADQAPRSIPATDPELEPVEVSAYNEKRYVYRIDFETAYDGHVTIRCLVQFEVMQKLMASSSWSMTWTTLGTGADENLHPDMELKNQPGVVYTTVLSKRDIKALYERMCIPYPEGKSITEAWEILYGKGMVKL